MERLIFEMVGVSTIQPSHNPFASLVMFVKKKDLSWWLCVDYRAFNKLMTKKQISHTFVEELLEELTGVSVFLKIDLHFSYHHI